MRRRRERRSKETCRKGMADCYGCWQCERKGKKGEYESIMKKEIKMRRRKEEKKDFKLKRKKSIFFFYN